MPSTLLNDLLSYWLLDEGTGTNAADSVGDVDMTLTGSPAPTWVGGGGLVFDGDNYAVSDNNPYDAEDLESGTIALVVKTSTAGISEALHAFNIEGWVWVGIDENSKASGISDGQGTQFAASEVSIDDDEEHLLTLEWDTTDFCRVYVDGVLEGEFEPAGTPNVGSTSRPATIGAQWNGALGFVGTVKKVGLWSRALTDGERAELYNGGDVLAYPFDAPAPTVYRIALRGGSIIRNTFRTQARGAATVYNTFRVQARGGTSIGYLPVRVAMRGARAIYNQFRVQARGQRGTRETFRIVMRGSRRAIYNTFRISLRGHRSIFQTFRVGLRGLGRVANDDQARFELYVAAGVDPNPDGAVNATSPTLPIDSTPLAAGNTYHFLTLRRNRWGVRHPIGPVQVMTLNEAGQWVTPAPASPTNITAESLAGGRIRIRAQYAWEAEPAGVAGNQWLIWTAEGVDPDPDVDVPVVVAHGRLSSIETLIRDAGAFTGEPTVHVLVRVRRSGDSVQSINTATVQVQAGPDDALARTPQAFLGKRAKQE
jgi:hypothetical protein